MAFLTLATQVIPDWQAGGTVGYIRVFSSQGFYEATAGTYVPQGQVNNLNSCYLKATATISGTNFTIPAITLATTTDSTVPNAVYTAVLYDSRNVPQYTLLANFFVDPSYLQVPAESSVLVSGAGTSAADGIYIYTGLQTSKPYYNLQGSGSTSASTSAISFASNVWDIWSSGSAKLYETSTSTDAYPWLVTSSWAATGGGSHPNPTVTEYTNIVASTWEQLTISNSGFAVVTPPSYPGPFWNVDQTKQYINTVIGTGTTPYAGTLVAGKTQLDTAPALASAPIAVGVNSTAITSLAPKASPTFTGTVTLPNTNLTGTLAITGGLTTTTTVVATGNVTGANLSGTNTGNVTKSGENYITLAGQAITANAVNLSGTNVTGTLAAARMPALTGDVTTSAGAVATTIANDAVTTAKILNANVTDAKIATGIDAAKIGGGAVSNTEFSYLDGVTSAIQTQITAKAPSVSPSFTTPALGTVASGVLTACTTATAANGTSDTTLASTAFVQGLGNGCKVYRAVLTQTGTSAPSATVGINTLGGSVVWGYTSTGFYTATLSSAFTANKTQIIMGTSVMSGTSFAVYDAVRTSTGVITLKVYLVDPVGASIGLTNALLTETPIEIVVFP